MESLVLQDLDLRSKFLFNMTTEEQLETWLEPFKQNPQEIIDSCWQHADIYSFSNPTPRSSICTYIINYDVKIWNFLGDLAEGNLNVWISFLIIVLLFGVLVSIIILFEIKLSSKNKY